MTITLEYFEKLIDFLDTTGTVMIIKDSVDEETEEREMDILGTTSYDINLTSTIEDGVEVPRGLKKLKLNKDECYVLISGEVTDVIGKNNTSLGLRLVPFASVISEEEFEEILIEESQNKSSNKDVSFLDLPKFKKERERYLEYKKERT